MFLGGGECFDNNVRGRRGKCGKDAARVEPACAVLTEDVIPVDVAGREFGRGGIATIDTTHCAAYAKSAFGEVEAVANRTAQAIMREPLDVIRIDAALHDEVFEQVSDFVVYETGYNSRTQAKTLAHAACHVVFAAAFPDAKVACCTHAAIARVEPQHDLAERDDIVITGFS